MKNRDVINTEKCSSDTRCKNMQHALSNVVHEAITDLSTFNLRTGKPTGYSVAVRLKGGKVGAFLFCPWCGQSMVRGKAG